MSNHENEKQFNPDRFSVEARKILESYGIDVEATLEKIQEEKRRQSQELTRGSQFIELKNLPIQDILTSELVQLCTSDEESSKYKYELQHQFSLLELSDKQKEMFIALDLAALEKKDPQMRKEVFVASFYIFDKTTVKSLPKPDSLFTSELVMIIDDADAAYARDHDWLPNKAFEAVSLIKGKYHYNKAKQRWVYDDEGPFAKELYRRFNLMELKLWQRNSFVKNECLITARAKWGYPPEEKSWTSESIVKKN